jgi:predicted outer membrane protein
MKKVTNLLWVYLLVISAITVSCTEEAEPANIQSDQDFVDYAVHTGIFKAQVSRLATQVAASTGLKALGNQLLTFYNSSNNELAILGRENGFSIPSGLDDKRQKLYNELDRLWGQDFDLRYLSEMQKVYQEDIKWFEEARSTVRNEALRNWAGKRLSELRVQQAEIQQMANGRGV